MLKKVVNGLVFSIIPIVLFYLMEGFEHNAFEEVRQLAQVYNIFLFELIAWILFFVTGSGKTALRIETVIAFVYGLVNHYIMAFRSTPFVPWDLYSIQTAASVAGNYDFTPTKEVLWVSAGFLLIFVLLRFLKFKFTRGVVARVIPAIGVTMVLCVFVNALWDDEFQTESYLYPFLFTPAHMTKVNGMAVTFAMDMEYLRVEKPDGYSVKKAEEILAKYENAEGDSLNENIGAGIISDGKNNRELPNIIVIMNEAFSDLSVLGEFTTNEDYMPFVHRLQWGYENTITGNLEVSVCGGNTANSEFEFLTGHTMDYFPIGSIPFQQYITKEVPSLASQLRDLGYETYGMHPYNASGWERDEVYPLLGFETAYFLHDFDGRYYIRNYVSDKTAYEKIIQIYEEKEAGVPMFAFEVTMQNHSGYTEKHGNFTPDIHVEEIEDFALDQYLSLMKVSDAEFEKLVQYFSEVDEKTMLVFFGDHQPNDSIANKILRLNGVNTANMTVEEAKLRYQVPYVIWANYDIEEAVNADTDISFLAAEVMETAGMPTTTYQNFLLELKKYIDVQIANDNSVDNETVEGDESSKSNESAIDRENDDENEHEKKLEEYQILQYYYMFDYEKE